MSLLSRSWGMRLHLYIEVVTLGGCYGRFLVVMEWLWWHVYLYEVKVICVDKMVSMGMLGGVGSMGC